MSSPSSSSGTHSDPFALPTRTVNDAKTMRALAHPLRVRLLELFALHPTLTATEAGEQLGESPSACSFHLRQLAKYGFVEEAEGGTGRARPWRAVAATLNITSAGGDASVEVAQDALSGLLRERQLLRLQGWLQTRRSYPEKWQRAASQTESVMWLTPEELGEITSEFMELLLDRYVPRRLDPSARPADALPVEFLFYSYPMTPPAEETSS